jgi:hypothetical protein
MKTKTRAEQPFSIKLNWKAYYKAFVEVHGEPLIYGGRQLFPDGWGYSLSDYAGPEWPPPTEPLELAKLQICYWKRRLAIAMLERRNRQADLDNLVQMQAARPIPLVHTVTLRDDEGRIVVNDKGRPERSNYTLDVGLQGLQYRLDWLDEDIQRCRERLAELSPIILEKQP